MNRLLIAMLAITIIVSTTLTGCSDSNSTSPTTAVGGGTSVLEGQLVADAGAQTAKLMIGAVQSAYPASSMVYPVNGVTVQLVRDGAVVATATTDEYGRFRFTDLESGDYEVRVVTNDTLFAHYHAYVNADQILSVYGRVVPGDCVWNEELGPHWHEMPNGPHWGDGFCGVSPGTGYWHDGQQWCEPQGSGPYHHGQPH